VRDLLTQLVDVVDDPASRAAESEGGADDQREADVAGRPLGVDHRVGVRAARHVETDGLHRLREELAVLPLLDHVELGTDEFDAVALQNA
jgi:hypothetical protein